MRRAAVGVMKPREALVVETRPSLAFSRTVVDVVVAEAAVHRGAAAAIVEWMQLAGRGN